MKISIIEPIGISLEKSSELEKEFKALGCQYSFYNDRKEDNETLIQRMRDADIVVVSNIKIDKHVLASCPNLKMLSVAFTGIDHIDTEYCKEKGIEIHNAAGYATDAVSELSVGLMIDALRKITELDFITRACGDRNGFLGSQLKGKTIGIVGTGAIGIRTAQILRVFGAEIIAWSRSERSEALELGIRYVALEELMSKADIVSLHVPLTKETIHLIDEKILSLCKPDAVIINTARGNVIDIAALAKCLKEGRIAAAAIDVYEKEPPLDKNHILFNAPNCILVPHIAFATKESFAHRIDIVINNIKSFLNR